MRISNLIVLGALSGTAACGASERNVSGKLDLSSFGRTGAELVAVSDDGSIRSVDVGRDGRFEVRLEAEHDYALAFRSPGHGRVFANAVLEGGGRRSSILRCGAGDDIDLGVAERDRESGSSERCACRESSPSDASAGGSGRDTGRVVSTVLVRMRAPEDMIEDRPRSEDDLLSDRDRDGRPDSVDEDDDSDGLCDDERRTGCDDDSGPCGDDSKRGDERPRDCDDHSGSCGDDSRHGDERPTGCDDHSGPCGDDARDHGR